MRGEPGHGHHGCIDVRHAGKGENECHALLAEMFQGPTRGKRQSRDKGGQHERGGEAQGIGDGYAVATLSLGTPGSQGEGDGAGYLLVNVAGEPGLSSANELAAPGATGTSGMFANVFYWLDKDDDLKPHVGHRVEIEGEREGDVKDGELKIERKDLWTEIEVKSVGRQMKAQVPNASVVAGRNADRKFDVLVRRVDVKKVRMVDAACR